MLKETELEQLLSDPYWRLNNLYQIRDQNGKKIRFQMNWAQEQLYKELWYLNVILKARLAPLQPNK